MLRVIRIGNPRRILSLAQRRVLPGRAPVAGGVNHIDALSASFWSRADKKNEPWPISTSTIARHLVVKPLLTGAGYGAIGLVGAAVAMPSGLFGLSQLGILFVTTNLAFGVGSSVGTITGAKTCLVEGKWLVQVLPISSVAFKFGSGKTLSTEAAESLALTLKNALNTPSFVPWMARPFWRFAMNQAIPLDSLLLVPDRILESIDENPNAVVGAVVEAVMLSVVAEGLDNLKSRYRWWGIGGVTTVYGACVSLAVWASLPVA